MTATATSEVPSAPRNGQSPLRVMVMTGSTRADRFGPVPAAWIAERGQRRDDVEVDAVDLAGADLPTVMAGNDEDASVPEPVAALGRRIETADAVVIVTPVYNRAYPASLKNAIDWFHGEWAATPVGFVSYGGRTGGVEAVEQLRPVFVELGTMTIRNVLTFPDFWEAFDDQGLPKARAATDRAADEFYDQLIWWARALRTARNEAVR